MKIETPDGLRIKYDSLTEEQKGIVDDHKSLTENFVIADDGSVLAECSDGFVRINPYTFEPETPTKDEEEGGWKGWDDFLGVRKEQKKFKDWDDFTNPEWKQINDL